MLRSAASMYTSMTRRLLRWLSDATHCRRVSLTALAGQSVSVLLLAALAAAMTPSAVAARAAKPSIRGVEVGYFGGATVTRRVSVFVYPNLGPSAGDEVTVCLEGRCEQARGHARPAPWYAAAFRTRGLRMGDPIKFAVIASDAAGHTKLAVTRDLLCMHNDGSTPQS